MTRSNSHQACLRPYQEDCVTRIFERLDSHPSTVAVLATGLGKTVIFSRVAQQWPQVASACRRGRRVMVIAHRDELIRQAAGKLESEGLHVQIEMADEFADERSACAVVSSVQTICRPKRQRRFHAADFGLLIIDEAHHSTAASYRGVIDYFRAGNPDIRVLGVTATPRRADGLAIGQVFDTVAFDYGIAEGIADAWLVPVRQRIVPVVNLDFSKLRTISGDWDQGELETICCQEKVLHQMAAPIAQEAGDCPTLVFCVGVKQAELLAQILDRYRTGSAAFVSGKTPRDERQYTVKGYQTGKLQFLVNCGVFLEGFDAPNTRLVAMCRPTQSVVLYTQCLGRVTRCLPGVVDVAGLTLTQRQTRIAQSGKPHGVVLDFVGNVEKHNDKLVTAADILGGNYSPEIRKAAARQVADEDKPLAVERALELAEADTLLLQEEAERRRKIIAQAQYQTREIALGGPALTRGGTGLKVEGPMGEPATRGQIRMLVGKFGWDEAKASRLSKRQAQGVIGKLLAG